MPTDFTQNDFNNGDLTDVEHIKRTFGPINDLESGAAFYRTTVSTGANYVVDFQASANSGGHYLSSLTAGQMIVFKADQDSLTNAQLQVTLEGGSATVPLHIGDTQVGAGDIKQNQIIVAIYNNTTTPRFDIVGASSASGGGASSLNQLSDVAIVGTPMADEFLKHDGTSFTNVSATSARTALDVPTNADLTTGLAGKANLTHTHAISDVTNLQTSLDGKQSQDAALDDISGLTLAKGDILVHDGTNATKLASPGAANNGHLLSANSTVTEGVEWVAPPSGGSGGATSLNGLSDVDIVGTPATDEFLKHDGTSFTNVSAASARTALDVPTNAALTSGLAGKADTTHTHAIFDVTNLQSSLDAKQDNLTGTSDVPGLDTALAAKQATSEKGQANGYAELDSSGKVPTSQLPSGSSATVGTGQVAYGDSSTGALTSDSGFTYDGTDMNYSGSNNSPKFSGTGSNSTRIGPSAVASGSETVAIGDGASATGLYDVAIGDMASASGNNATALGRSATASGNGIALGLNASAPSSAIAILGTAQNAGSIVIGGTESSATNGNLALGGTVSAGLNVAIGGAANASGTQECVALGVQANCTGAYSTAVGANSDATASYASAFGRNAQATGSYSLSLGGDSAASNTGAVSLGCYSTAGNTYATSIGYNTTASGSGSLAGGNGASATGLYNVSLGYNAQSAGQTNVAIGAGAVCNASYNGVALGANSDAGSGSSSVAILGTCGPSASVAIGSGATTAASSVAPAVAIGPGASVTSTTGGLAVGSYSAAATACTALGPSAQANGSFSIAIGYGVSFSPSYSVGIGGEPTSDHQLLIGGSNFGECDIRSVFIGNGVTNSAPQSVTHYSTQGSGTDVGGASYTIRPGAGTGTGTGGSFAIQTAPAGTTGSVLNAYSTVLEASGEGGIGMFGVSPVARSSGWSATYSSARKSFDSSTVTLSELAEVVGTMVDYFKSLGPLGA